MKTEEAMKHLSSKISFCEITGEGWADAVKVEALEMALEALKQSKTEKAKWGKPTELSESICSNCKKAPKTQFGCLPNYCPNCGAKMEKQDG